MVAAGLLVDGVVFQDGWLCGLRVLWLACWWVGKPPVLIGWREDSKMVLACPSILVVEPPPQISVASMYVPRASSNCLLLLYKALQDQQRGLTQAPFHLLALHWVSDHVRLCVCVLQSGIYVSYRPPDLLYVNPASLQGPRFWGFLPGAGPQDWGAGRWVWILCTLVRTSAIMIIPFVHCLP